MSTVIQLVTLIVLAFRFLHSADAAEAYGAYGFYPQGTARVLGMAGAFTGLSDDASAINANPAGLAQARWRFDLSSDSHRIINKEIDLSGDGQNDALPYSASNTAMASRFGSVGFALGYTEQYNLNFDFGGTGTNRNLLQVSSYDAAFAWAPVKAISVGVTIHHERTIQGVSNYNTSSLLEEDRAEGLYYTYGLLWRLHPTISMGISLSEERLYDIDEGLNATTSSSWFHDIYIPEKLSVGFLFRSSSRLKWVFDFDSYGSRQQVLFIGSTSSYYSSKPVNVFRGGFEYLVVSDKVVDFIWRGGAYSEPPRVTTLNSRDHFTMGVSLRWGFVTLSAAYDQATDFSTTSNSASVSFSALSDAIL